MRSCHIRGAPSPWTAYTLLAAGVFPGLVDAWQLLREAPSLFNLIGCARGLAWSFCVVTCLWIYFQGQPPRLRLSRRLVLGAAVIVLAHWLLPTERFGAEAPVPRLLVPFRLYVAAIGPGWSLTTHHVVCALWIFIALAQLAAVPLLALMLLRHRPMPRWLGLFILLTASAELLFNRAPGNLYSPSIDWLWLGELFRFLVRIVEYIAFIVGWGMLPESHRSSNGEIVGALSRATSALIANLTAEKIRRTLVVLGVVLLIDYLVPRDVSHGETLMAWELTRDPMFQRLASPSVRFLRMYFPLLAGLLLIGQKFLPTLTRRHLAILLLLVGFMPAIVPGRFGWMEFPRALAWQFWLAACALIVAGRIEPAGAQFRRLLIVASGFVLLGLLFPFPFNRLLAPMRDLEDAGTAYFSWGRAIAAAFADAIEVAAAVCIVMLSIQVFRGRVLSRRLAVGGLLGVVAPILWRWGEYLAKSGRYEQDLVVTRYQALYEPPVFLVTVACVICGLSLILEPGLGTAVATPVSATSPTESRLAELEQLRARGLITQAEYDAKRADLISKL